MKYSKNCIDKYCNIINGRHSKFWASDIPTEIKRLASYIYVQNTKYFKTAKAPYLTSQIVDERAIISQIG